jgi:hypothetical protein
MRSRSGADYGSFIPASHDAEADRNHPQHRNHT